MSEEYKGKNNAFPQAMLDEDGMNIRTYLAGQALAGLAGTPEFLLQVMEDVKTNPEILSFTQLVAKASVRLADATLAELAKEKTP